MLQEKNVTHKSYTPYIKILGNKGSTHFGTLMLLNFNANSAGFESFNKVCFLKERLAKSSILRLSWSNFALNFQFSNALRIIEMVPVLKKLKVWTLYLHIVAQVNHRGLGVKVETNCLRDSDLIPRHSFLSTTFSTFINGVSKFMCVCVFSGGC